jgi:hypothetical protein
MREGGQAIANSITEWLAIPRQLKYLAWAFIGLGLASVAVRLMALLRTNQRE